MEGFVCVLMKSFGTVFLRTPTKTGSSDSFDWNLLLSFDLCSKVQPIIHSASSHFVESLILYQIFYCSFVLIRRGAMWCSDDGYWILAWRFRLISLVITVWEGSSKSWFWTNQSVHVCFPLFAGQTNGFLLKATQVYPLRRLSWYRGKDDNVSICLNLRR